MLTRFFTAGVWLLSAAAQGVTRLIILFSEAFGITLSADKGIFVSALSVLNILFSVSILQIISRSVLYDKSINALFVFGIILTQGIFGTFVGIYIAEQTYEYYLFLTLLTAIAAHTVLRQKYIAMNEVFKLLSIDLFIILFIFGALQAMYIPVLNASIVMVFLIYCMYSIDGEWKSKTFREDSVSFTYVSLSNLATSALPFLIPLFISSFDMVKGIVEVLTFIAVLISVTMVVPRAIFNKLLGGGDLARANIENGVRVKYIKHVLVYYLAILPVLGVMVYIYAVEYIGYKSSVTWIFFLLLYVQSLLGALSYFDINLMTITGNELSVFKINMMVLIIIAISLILIFVIRLSSGLHSALLCYLIVTIVYGFRYRYLSTRLKA